jgi:hypothetical protein
MPKYYITSGQLRFITVADTHMEACYKALQKARRDSIELEKYFYVSERGFRGPTDSPVIDTESVPDEQIDIRDVEDK